VSAHSNYADVVFMKRVKNVDIVERTVLYVEMEDNNLLCVIRYFMCLPTSCHSYYHY